GGQQERVVCGGVLGGFDVVKPFAGPQGPREECPMGGPARQRSSVRREDKSGQPAAHVYAAQLLAGLDVPQVDAVAAAGRQDLAVGRDGGTDAAAIILGAAHDFHHGLGNVLLRRGGVLFPLVWVVGGGVGAGWAA